MFATAFQPTAFQSNAFQIDAGVQGIVIIRRRGGDDAWRKRKKPQVREEIEVVETRENTFLKPLNLPRVTAPPQIYAQLGQLQHQVGMARLRAIEEYHRGLLARQIEQDDNDIVELL